MSASGKNLARQVSRGRHFQREDGRVEIRFQGSLSSLAADGAAPVEQPFLFPDERLGAAQPAAAAPGEVGYGELVDSSADSGDADEAAIVRYLLEYPGILEMISEENTATPVPPSFEQEPDTSASFFNMDVNQNLGAYPLDFPRYNQNELQYNMLLSESHNPQAEAPDGLCGGAVQVKREEEQ